MLLPSQLPLTSVVFTGMRGWASGVRYAQATRSEGFGPHAFLRLALCSFTLLRQCVYLFRRYSTLDSYYGSLSPPCCYLPKIQRQVSLKAESRLGLGVGFFFAYLDLSFTAYHRAEAQHCLCPFFSVQNNVA